MTFLSICRNVLKNSFKYKSFSNHRHKLSFTTYYRSSASLGEIYRPFGISRVLESTPETLRVEFKDSLTAEFYYIWLRDSCNCKKCVDPTTEEKLLDPVSINLSISPRFCHIKSNGQLNIMWREDDGEHDSLYDPRWLHRYGSGFKRNLYEAVHDCFPPVEYWDGKSLQENIQKIEHEEVMQSQRGINKCLEAIYKHGLILLQNVPCEPGEIINVMNRIANIRNTRWGSSFHIISDDNSDVYLPPSEKDLKLHTDMNYLEKSPGLQVFHCLETRYKEEFLYENNKSAEYYFVDGFYASKWLKENYPVYFDALTSIPVKFRKRFNDALYFNYQPILKLNKSREVSEVHFDNRRMAPLEGPHRSVLNFYAGYRLFSEFIRIKENQFSMLLKPGDMVILSNRRVLHGKRGYDSNLLSRHIEGCYAEVDDVMARYRTLLWHN